jgi:hypothetical protein
VKFRVLGGCTDPLFVRDGAFDGTAFVNVGNRPLVMLRIHASGYAYRNDVTTNAPLVFGNMVSKLETHHDQRGYFRAIDSESPVAQWRVESGSMWVMGFKSEKASLVFDVTANGTLEVLGGIMNQYSQESSSTWLDSLAIRNAGGKISVVACTNGPNKDEGFETLVRDTQGGVTKNFAWNAPVFPIRVGRMHQSFIPLYVSY